MKKLAVIVTMLMSVNVLADSNDCLKQVINRVNNNVDSREFKDNVKAFQDGVKTCRKIAQREKLENRIKELTLKLQASK